ncbi:MAG: hypothetical protein WCQ99_17455, partial [Pseudomonadota bacterium]
LENFPHLADLIIPGRLPDYTKAVLHADGREIVLGSGPVTFDLAGLTMPSESLTLEIRYEGLLPLIQIPVPRIKALLTKHTACAALNELAVHIDNQTLPIAIANLPSPYGGWIDLGKFDIAAGKHLINAENKLFFRIKTLMLETTSPLPDQTTDGENEPQKGESFFVKLAMLLLKTIIACFILWLVWVFRGLIMALLQLLLMPVWNVLVKLYTFLPEKIMLFLWLLCSGALYGSGIAYSKSISGENYAFTFGGIAMVIFLWHCMRIIRQNITTRYPALSSYIYRSRGTPFFSGAIMLLAVTAFSVALHLEAFAEQIAILVYYLLVAGVIGEVVELKRNKQK